MPAKFHIHTEPAPPRFRPVGKLGIVDWREDCSNCHNCVKKACVYDRYRQEMQYIKDMDEFNNMFFECMGCFSCVQKCTKGLLALTQNPEYERMGKLQKMIQVLQTASAPPEIAIIEQLIQLPDAATIEQALTQNPDIVTQGLLDTLTGLATQMESQGDNPEAKAMGEKLGEVYKIALKVSMKKNME